jgi:hypothetical protein
MWFTPKEIGVPLKDIKRPTAMAKIHPQREQLKAIFVRLKQVGILGEKPDRRRSPSQV